MTLDQVVEDLLYQAFDQSSEEARGDVVLHMRLSSLIKQEMGRFAGRACFNLIRTYPPVVDATTPAERIKQAVELAITGHGISPTTETT